MDILSLGQKIKKLRKEKNLTLKELAGDRITAAQISHIERDKSYTSQELLDYLSKKLDVSIDHLLETKEMQAKKITDNLIIQCEIYVKAGNLETAKKEISKIMDICKNYSLTENYASCNFLLGTIHLEQEDYDLAVANFEKALFLYIKNNNKESIVNCYINIGKIYMKENFYKAAINHFDFAEDVLSDYTLQNINTYRDLYSSIAYSYIRLGQNDKVLGYTDKIKALEKGDNNKDEADRILLTANGLLQYGNYDEAKIYFQKALDIYNKENNKNELASIYTTMCKIYINSERYETALEYANKAYEIKKNDEDENTIKILFKIIKSLIGINDFESAKKYIKTALSLSIKTKNKMLEYRSLKYYSIIYAKEGNYDISIENLNKCLEIVKEANDKKIIGDLYIEMAQVYSNISKDRELEYYQKAISIYKDLDIIEK
ncbi:MAG TPA: tetratricopeptide repeat protein [Peptostreptococcaceae bacterium]|nr:tetratricopeptide repeat protein [Peptostreptococcaceae bacterium]